MNSEDLPQIDIDVETQYIEEQSEPASGRYVFAYTITISNPGQTGAKLLNRHWLITDANNKVEEVRGEGVVGEQPHLQPGEKYQYTSGAVLDTPVGTMQGEYEFVTDDGRNFLAPIDRFTLSIPRVLH
jgi:ApaG protein